MTKEKKDVNIRIGGAAYKRLKVTAAKYGITLKSLLEEYSKIRPTWEPK